MSEGKYKILVIGPGGRHVENFISRIKNDVSNIVLITDKPCEVDDDIELFMVSFSLKSIKNLFSTSSKISAIIEEFNPDIIHVHQLNSVAYYSVRANKQHKKPIIVTAWGSDILVNPDKSNVLKQIVRYVLKRATAFTADAHFVKDKMIALLPEKELDITVCNFGVEETNLSLDKQNVIYSNRLHNKLYRIEHVLEAFAKFSEVNTNWKLIVAAVGSETDKLKQLVIDLNIQDKVEFPGFVSKELNNQYYSISKLYVSIPESDATAISLLEAMYYGCIPVVSDLPANHEWIEHNKNGIIVKDINTEFISSALSLIDTSAGVDNRNKILESGTESISRKKFVSLHKRLIGLK